MASAGSSIVIAVDAADGTSCSNERCPLMGSNITAKKATDNTAATSSYDDAAAPEDIGGIIGNNGHPTESSSLTPPFHRLRHRHTLSALRSLQSSRLSNYRVSSLDFEAVINRHSIQDVRRRFSLPDDDGAVVAVPSSGATTTAREADNSGGRTSTRWILTVVAGLLTGVTSILLVSCTGATVRLRSRVMRVAIDEWRT